LVIASADPANRGRVAVLAIAISAVLVAASIVYVGPSHADDTFIYMRYVDNFLRGNGLSFNPREPSHGMTSVVLTLLMIPPSALFGNTLAVWKGVSWFCYGVLCLWASWSILSRARHLVPAVLLVVAVLVEAHLFRWSGSGMDNALAALAILAILLAWRAVLLERGGGAAMGPLLGVLPFVRPELALLGGLLVLEWTSLARARSEWRGFIRAIAVAAAVAVVMAGAMFLTTGFLLPQTAEAKAIAWVQGSTPWYALERTTLLLATGAGVFVPAALGLLRFPQVRPLIRPALVFMAAVSLYLAWRNHLVTTRYSVSLNFPVMVCVGVALVDLGRARLAVVLPAFVAQAAIVIAVLIYAFPGTRTSEGEDIRRFAEQVKAVTDQGARIAISEVGAFGFFADRYVIDTSGLIDPQTVAWLRVHGQVTNFTQMEQLLEFRGATHFVDAAASSMPIVGNKLRLVPLIEGPVRRNNVTAWNGVVWRLYRIEAPEPWLPLRGRREPAQ
jgi:arabinofuranosyltransferase